jgi:Family of unknown function (DUF5335)
MATSQSISKDQWRTFFDLLSSHVLGKRVEIEAASLDLGDQIVAEWVPLVGITYDSHDDALDVGLLGLDHRIRQPREVSVEEGPEGIESIAVVSGDGVTQILRLKDPLMLPAARGPSPSL